MNRTRMCRAFARAGVLVAALALAPSAFAHAHLYPDEMPSGHGSLLQLAVPNEEENASTTADRDDRAERLRARERRDRARLDRHGERQHGDLEGQARRRAARAPAVHRLGQGRGRLRVQGQPDLLGRQRRRLGGHRGLRHARPGRSPSARRARRGGVALRLEQDDRHHRARRRRARAAHRRRRASSPGGARNDAAAGGRARCSSPSWLHWPCRRWRGDTPRCSRTQPQASGVLTQPPTEVRLTFSERIEPRFAVISVTDAGGNQQIAGSPARTADDENAIFVPVKALSQGWYLVWWRVISADGHPIRGAFTFAVGPSPGPATAVRHPVARRERGHAEPRRHALGAAAGDDGRDRPARVPRRDRPAAAGDAAGASAPCGASRRRPRSRWAWRWWRRPSTSLLATAEFSLRPWSDLGEIVPLVRDSGFGRAFSDLWVVLALLAVAARDRTRARPAGRKRRSGEALLARFGAAGCAAAALALPGLAGHPSTTSPVGAMLALDWAHLAAASIWIGGLVGPARAGRGDRARASASRRSPSSCRASRASPWAASPSCSRRASSRASCTCRRSARSGRRATGRR